MDPSTPTPSSEEKSEKSPLPFHKYYIKLLKNKNFLIVGGLFLFLLIFIPLILIVLPRGNTTNKQQNKTAHITPIQTPTPGKKPAKPQKPAIKLNKTLLYGTWTSQSSILKAVDVDTSTVTTLTTLPLAIKQISVLSNHTLLYIDQVDSNGYGQRISVYDLQQEQITTNIPADTGFGIVSYVLSPNKRYLTFWEVQLSQDTNTLQGGDSRIDIVDLTQPTLVNQLFDETPTATIPIHYPVAVLNDGTVFTDQMILSGTTISNTHNFAYGMNIIDSDGTNEQTISSMTNGTYGSVPTLSADGKYMLFAGYNGSNGDGTVVKSGIRQALLTPNTIELLDTHTLKRYALPNLPNTNIYSNAQWDTVTDNPIITVLSPDLRQVGVFSYDLTKLTLTQLPLPTINGTSFSYVSELTNTATLAGTQSTDSASIGDLGQTTTYGYNQLATINTGNKLAYLSLPDPLVQYIAVLPGNYFKDVLGASTSRSIPASTHIKTSMYHLTRHK